MAQVIVRNLDEQVVLRLKERAALHQHSLEQELRDILSAVARGPGESRVAEADRIRAMTPRGRVVDVEEMVREDRDRR